MKLFEKEYDEFEKQLGELSYESDYIPSLEDLDSIVKNGNGELKVPDRFVPFLMWIDMHHPDPIDEYEEESLKKIRKMLYHNMEIVDGEETEEVQQ